jgi:primosomal protein N' (replication factor Y)
MTIQYVEVATALPIDRTFQYLVTGKERYAPAIGKRVVIPFREMRRIGYIVSIDELPKVESPKPLIDIIDEKPLFSEEMVAIAVWMKDQYLCSLGEALGAMLPGTLKGDRTTARSRLREEATAVAPTEPHVPNTEQEAVLKEIDDCLNTGKHEVLLLHGITGSGKTEIYLQSMANVLARGKTGIMLVPEISLTPQTVERFISRFGDKVAVFHSKMLESVKFKEWKRIKDGEARIVVGPRSAIFSPMEDPGIFIVDEEHEPSYKQDDVPRYHAREVAIQRAKALGVPVILGSATPALESFHKAVLGEYKLVELTQRINENLLPKVKIVDMRMELDTRTGKQVISTVLGEALKKDIKKHQQALLFLNRRGFSTFVNCRSCGHVVKCKRCDSPMVLHSDDSELICHYCNYRLAPPKICPSCSKDYLMYRGTGTEKVEIELKRLIPEARVARMDSDTMAKRGAHEKLLTEFKEHKIDIIVGTQMIAKGLDFPKVTQVGVISADSNLNLPDFRSGERTFNLITQVAGRAGRGDLGGEVIVQTYTPDNYSILCAAKHDYAGFYVKEIESRRMLGFPPFTRLIKVTLRARSEELTRTNCEAFAERVKKNIPGVDIMGPAPSPLAKLRGYYRWNVLIKVKDMEGMLAPLRKTLEGFKKSPGVLMAVDVDPMSM